MKESFLQRHSLGDENDTLALAADFGKYLLAGDVVLLEGELGAGKTTFVRGLLAGLGHGEPVRSPTYNIIQTFETDPPVMHADLYRLRTGHGLGLEDYFGSYLCLIEWPDRLAHGISMDECYRVQFEFDAIGRLVTIHGPMG